MGNALLTVAKKLFLKDKTTWAAVIFAILAIFAVLFIIAAKIVDWATIILLSMPPQERFLAGLLIMFIVLPIFIHLPEIIHKDDEDISDSIDLF